MRLLKQNPRALIAAMMIALMPFAPVVADVSELNVLGPDRSFPRASRAYVNMDEPFVRIGTPRTVAQVRAISLGSSKNQLVGAIGQPKSAYGDGSWNFDISFALPQGNRLICQYRVYFDAADQVAGTVWRRPQCLDIIIGNAG